MKTINVVAMLITVMLLTPMTMTATAASGSSATGNSAVAELTITADTSSVQVGISKGVTFYVEKPGTVTCMAIDCPEPEPAMHISGANVHLEGVAAGSGTTGQNGYSTIYINANSAGTITVIASKSGYSDGSTTIMAEMPPTPSQPSVTFVSDKNSYVRDNLIYFTMKNDGDQSVILSGSNSVHWWIENIIYTSETINTVETTSDTSDSNAIATSDSTVSNTQLFPGDSITVPWDQRDNNKNLVPQGRYIACVRWSYNGQYYRSCTKSFDIIVQDSPTPCPTYTSPYCPNGNIVRQGTDNNGCDKPSICVTCPTYTSPYCPNGNIVRQGTDNNGCDKPSICVTQTTTAPILPVITTPNIRVGPTVNLRPVKDDISISEDGFIELYMNNPSLNDETLHADVTISVPSGISVYGQGFGNAGSAGVLHGIFDITPGKSRTIYMTIRAERAGEFLIKFSGTYWPGDNKNDFEPISLTHSIKVRDILTPKTVPTVNDRYRPVIEGFGTFIKSILDFLDNIFGPI